MGNFLVTTIPTPPIATQYFQLKVIDEYNLIDNSRTYSLVLNNITFTNYTITEPSQIVFNNVYSNISGTVPYSIYESPYNIYNSTLDINPVCYVKGTQILCLIDGKEKYVKIEDLKKNTLVKTYLHGYKKLKILGKLYVKNCIEYKYNKIFKLSKEKNKDLIEDLYVSGKHSILVDSLSDEQIKRIHLQWTGLKILDSKYLLLASASEDFEDVKDENVYEVYQIILENNNNNKRYGVWANGILSESVSMNNFINKKQLVNSFLEIND
jgi:hypothetical protein